MTPFGWLVASGLVAFPFLFAYAYREYRRGNRTKEGFVKSLGIGAMGLSTLLQQASQQWLTNPADDVVAAVSVIVLVAGLYALYRGYVRGDGDEVNGDPVGREN